MSANINNQAFNQLRLLEERVRLHGAAVPEDIVREYWTAVKCRVDGVNVMFQLQDVSEIIEHKNLTRLPGCAAWIKGVLNFRGRLLPVYDISQFFCDRPGSRQNPSAQIIVIEQGAMLCGLVPDELCGMQKIYYDDENIVSKTSLDTNKLILEYADSALSINDETWNLFDLKLLARMLFQANPDSSYTVGNTLKIAV